MQKALWCISGPSLPARSRRRERGRRARDPVAYGSYEALARGPCHRGGLQPAPQPPPSRPDARGHPGGKHVLCVEAHRALRRRSAPAPGGARGRESDGGFSWSAFHPQWLPGPRVGPRGRIGTLRAVQVSSPSQHGPGQHPGTKRRSAAEASMTSAATPSSARDSSSSASLGALWRSSIATRPLAPTGDQRPGGLRRGPASSASPCPLSAWPYQRVQIWAPAAGSRSRSLQRPAGGAMRILLDDGPRSTAPRSRRKRSRRATSTRSRARLFSRAVRGRSTCPTAWRTRWANMRVIDALFRSEKSGRWEEV